MIELEPDLSKPTIPLDTSTLSRAERRRLARNVSATEQQQFERIAFIFARKMEEFRFEARKEFKPEFVEKFINFTFQAAEPPPKLKERIQIKWLTWKKKRELKKKIKGLKLISIEAQKRRVKMGQRGETSPAGNPVISGQPDNSVKPGDSQV